MRTTSGDDICYINLDPSLPWNSGYVYVLESQFDLHTFD